ncbi:MAG: DUF3450 domain-containing protein [Gammaproteobacteria bacterium]|nr:DUF3450 domain-containing protein [Gammaproteobacteria bacterium]
MTQYSNQYSSHKLPQLLAVLSIMAGGVVAAQTPIEDLFIVAQALNEDAAESQAQLDELDDERAKLYGDYQIKLKEIDGQKVYNRQVQLVVNRQEDKIARLKKSIEEVTSIQRNITPLIWRMIEALDQFVTNDLPFAVEERIDRVDRLRTLMDSPDVAISEKFSQVLRAYQIESEYGRTIQATETTITLDGQERNVDLLRIGRITLAYQTGDGKETGWWNPNAGAWEPLGDTYTIPVRNGLKMARKQRTQGLIRVPILVPEASTQQGG